MIPGAIRSNDSGKIFSCGINGKVFSGMFPFAVVTWDRLVEKVGEDGDSGENYSYFEEERTLFSVAGVDCVDIGGGVRRITYSQVLDVSESYEDIENIDFGSIVIEFNTSSLAVAELAAVFWVGANPMRSFIDDSSICYADLQNITIDESTLIPLGKATLLSARADISVKFLGACPVSLDNHLISVEHIVADVSMTGEFWKASRPDDKIPKWDPIGPAGGGLCGRYFIPGAGYSRGVKHSSLRGGTTGTDITKRWNVYIGIGPHARTRGETNFALEDEIDAKTMAVRCNQYGYNVRPYTYSLDYTGTYASPVPFKSDTFYFVWRYHYFELNPIIGDLHPFLF